MKIPLAKPDISELEVQRVLQVMQSPFLSGGPVLKEFEAKLARLAGTRHAVAVSSGTAALHLILLALGIGPGDEVITTPYSFIASANCILYTGAQPVFCDIDAQSPNLDPELIEAQITARTKAILVVHVFGIPADLEAILRVAERHNLPVIEDSCEAIGAKINGKPVGSWGIAGTFAFYPNKQITTGEGGAIVTNDQALAEMTRSLANQGRKESDQWLEHTYLGYNYRLDEISAALGCAQLERLDEILELRSRVAEWYREELAEQPLVALPNRYSHPNAKVSWFVYVVRFASPTLREIVADHLTAKEIQNRPYFPAIHLQPCYQQLGFSTGMFPNTETSSATSLALPFFTRMSRDQVIEVCSTIKEILALYRY